MVIYDFDGVMIDSLSEVLVTAYNTASGELVTRLQDLPEGFEKLFRKNRYHVQPAEDFPILAQWCIDCLREGLVPLLNPAEYEELIDSNDEPPDERRNRFFATRERFLAKDRNSWLDLNRPMQPLWQRLQKVGAEAIVILTNKNKPAVIELCGNFDLAVDPANIYSAESGATKTDNLMAIRHRFNQSHYYFLDDSLQNLQQLRSKFDRENDITFLLANWGYTGPDDEEVARSNNIQSYTQEGFLSFIENLEVP